MKLKAVIIANERAEDHFQWIRACDRYHNKISYRIVDLTRDNWLEAILSDPFDILLAKPGGLTSLFKQLYDERIYILGKVLKFKIFPSPDEIFIYENKRFLSYWLKANRIPHPETHVFYNSDETIEFLNNTSYPLVGKANIGASSSGVVVINNHKEAIEYARNAFSSKGVQRRHGPNLKTGKWGKRVFFYLKNPVLFSSKINIYRMVGMDYQKGFVIFQEYIPHNFEWRIVRIGDSFFGHKKLKAGDKASGSLLKEYCVPPPQLLDFVKEITDKHGFFSQAIDIFESERGYLVNEMQCIFGQSDPHQMIVDGNAGRFIFYDNTWRFETGNFNANESFDNRVQWIIERFEANGEGR